MGRQEQPLDPGRDPLARFAYDLRELRRHAGSPPYRRLATRAHYSASTLAEAAAGRRLPGAAVLAAFVNACGGDAEEWEQRRIATHRLITAPSPAPALPCLDPAPGTEPAPASSDQDPAPAAASPAPAAASPDPGPVTVVPVPGRAVAATATPADADRPSAEAAPRRRTPDRPRRPAPWRRRREAGPVLLAVLLTLGAFAAGDAGRPRKTTAPASDGTHTAAANLSADTRFSDDGRRLRTDTDIPERYRALIVEAGTTCHVPQVTPVLVAAMLKAESGFDPELSDPAKDEYGIARWTPRVLRYYLPPDRQHTVPKPPFSPEDSIPAMGRMLCALAPELEGVPGDPALNLAAAYRTTTWKVQRQGAELEAIRPYLEQVRTAMLRYRPESALPPAEAAPGGR
ncbi:helix-turn-helix domain-containing protein [Streptomyces sp. BR123]|uniref:helix-turn-helix domain-containing protein n=1 Tax=Streptomyces sp. BR123 TaxID=2749828 RepID=UPI0015C4D1D9|nr:helix-turn-helix domain-containing protein [Streptomyces sp. BR123]NXY97544.1 helix-turn-helix domain-containing protein [Streptomyces sp. BR123]